MTETTQDQTTSFGVAGRVLAAGVALFVLGAVWAVYEPLGYALAGLGGVLINAAVVGHVIKGVLREVRDER